jgi:hypothetical protein
MDEPQAAPLPAPGGPRRPAAVLGRLAAIAALSAGLTWLANREIEPEHVGTDFIQFWAAGQLLASGRSPYDVAGQARIQQAQGWDKDKDGGGLYDFLPYYYPPWLALAFVPLLPLGFTAAKLAWVFLCINFLLHAGFLVRAAAPGVPRAIPVVLVPIFALSVRATQMGQTSPLMLFLTALTWSLLRHRRDRSAGAALAWLTIKPQLSLLLILAILLWTARGRRWGVLGGFLAMGALLVLASAAIVPSWPLQMLRASAETPMPSQHFPWIGLTWLLVLRSFGLPAVALWLLYAVVAIPVAGAVLRAALAHATALDDLVALSLLAVPFVAPYCQAYDLPLLLIPLVVLLGGRLPEVAGATLLVVMIIVPYPHLVQIDRIRLAWLPPSPPPYFTFFWIPLLLGGAWLATASGARGNRDDLDLAVARPAPD